MSGSFEQSRRMLRDSFGFERVSALEFPNISGSSGKLFQNYPLIRLVTRPLIETEIVIFSLLKFFV